MDISENTCVLLVCGVAFAALLLTAMVVALWLVWLRPHWKKIKELDTLVDFLVSTAKVDHTSPDPKNQKVGWEIELLLRMAERLLIGNGRPADYAEVCQRVLAILEGVPGVEKAVILLIRLARFNGERRLPLDDGKDSQLQTTADGLRREIEALSDDTRKWRLLSLFWYHLAVLHAARGRFGQAAQAQKESGGVAELFSDRSGAAVAYFLAAVYTLYQALLDGQPLEELQGLFSELEGEGRGGYAALVKAVGGTPLQDQWRANGAAHMLKNCALLGLLRYPRWDEWLRALSDAAKGLGTAWQPALAFAQAVGQVEGQDAGAEAALAAITRGADAELKALALLVLARRALAAGKMDQATELLGQLPQEPCARYVRVIAQRELAAAQQR